MKSINIIKKSVLGRFKQQWGVIALVLTCVGSFLYGAYEKVPVTGINVLVVSKDREHNWVVLLKEKGDESYGLFSKRLLKGEKSTGVFAEKIVQDQAGIYSYEIAQNEEAAWKDVNPVFLVRLKTFLPARELYIRPTRTVDVKRGLSWVLANALLGAETTQVSTVSGKKVTIDNRFLSQFQQSWPAVQQDLEEKLAPVAAVSYGAKPGSRRVPVLSRQERACQACTFINDPTARVCEVCESPLITKSAGAHGESEEKERAAGLGMAGLSLKEGSGKEVPAGRGAGQSIGRGRERAAVERGELREKGERASMPAQVGYADNNWFSIPVADRILFYDNIVHPRYFMLSNYFPHDKPLIIEDFWHEFADPQENEWGTTEQYFQAMKFPVEKVARIPGKKTVNPNYEVRSLIRAHGRPAADESKRIVKNPDAVGVIGTQWVDRKKGAGFWGSISLSIMLKAVRAKFNQDQEAQELLLSTGDKVLIEDTYKYGDAIWGAGRDGTGRNVLGQILMQVRDEIRDSKRQRRAVQYKFEEHTPDYFIKR